MPPAGSAPAAPASGGYQTPQGAFQGEDIYRDLGNYVKEWMANPNRYLSDFAQAQRKEMDLRLKDAEGESQNDLLETMAQRGLLGSSLEKDAQIDLQESIRRTRAAEEAAMYERLMGGEAQGRKDAGDLAATLGGLGVDLGAARRQDSQFAAQFEQDVKEFGFEMAFKNAELAQKDAFQRASLDLDKAIHGDKMAMDRLRLDLDTMLAHESMTMNRAELAERKADREQRAAQIQEDQRLQGKQIDSTTALAWATLDQKKADSAQQQSNWQTETTQAQANWEKAFNESQQRYKEWLRMQGPEDGGEGLPGTPGTPPPPPPPAPPGSTDGQTFVGPDGVTYRVENGLALPLGEQGEL